MKSKEIREAFLSYFEGHGHTRVESSSLVPGDDPTLLFTNAGMVQFKDVFLGQDQRGYTRAATSQRCVRAGGKHNDLENVGYTARHHTFFEMLGNFSFGDYFKEDAIRFAWEFLTGVLGLPPEKLWVTVYHEDKEAERIWFDDIGIDQTRFSRLGEKDNFWSMGDTGPCGPCSEIFYDHGPEVVGGPPGSPDEDGDRYIEIWNLVFMQFNRSADGSQTPLPKPSVDTGMGLERISAVMQGVHSNYEIDLFRQLLDAAEHATGATDYRSPSLRVIADHIRACAFLVSDGVMPSNEGRGYVLRRILRRACRHGHKLGARGAFFHKLVAPLVDAMGEAYPELGERQAQIEKVLLLEEEQFARTLDQGLRILEQDLTALGDSTIPGELAFKLYDTYGFPLDLTADIARERDLKVDEAGFAQAMEAQRDRARKASSFVMDESAGVNLDERTEFTGYQDHSGEASIIAVLKDGELVDQLEAGEEAAIILDKTPFYAESGGQVGDCGVISNADARFEVLDTRKQGSAFLHQGTLASGTLVKGGRVRAEIKSDIRQATALNHSATHLMHAALREVLGSHVTQKGSLVNADRLRFDFSHFEAIDSAQLQQIEAIVNAQIRANSKVGVEVTDMETAKSRGAMALFGEKYGAEVRVLNMGDGFSVELCGGTHVDRTGDIGLMRIVSESGIAAGVRRIEAVTGAAALAQFDAAESQNQQVAKLLKSGADQVLEKLEHVLNTNKQLEKEVSRLKAKLASGVGSDISSEAIDVGGVKVLASTLDGADVKTLRTTLDQLKNKLGSAVILLAAVDGDKVSIVAGVTKDLTDRLRAGDLVREAASLLGGKGGGRADMAQGGGNDVSALPRAMEMVQPWVESGMSGQ